MYLHKNGSSAQVRHGWRRVSETLSFTTEKFAIEGGRIIAFSCVPTDLFRLPWMAQVKLKQLKQNKPRLKLGRVLIGFGGGRCQLGWKEEREGRAIRIH